MLQCSLINISNDNEVLVVLTKISFEQVVSDEGRQRDLLMDDEEEDFLDECIVNPTGW